MNLQDEWLEIQRNEDPVARQAFLDRIDLEDAAPYIWGVVYSETDFFGDLHYHPIWLALPIRSFLTTGVRAKVAVTPLAFSENHYCLGDFLSSLIDHEGQHARDIYDSSSELKLADLFTEALSSVVGAGVPFRERLLKKVAAQEKRAISNQINNFDRRGCSHDYMEQVKEYRDYYNWVLVH